MSGRQKFTEYLLMQPRPQSSSAIIECDVTRQADRELRLGPRTPRAIALGSKPLAGSSVRSHSVCRPGNEASIDGHMGSGAYFSTLSSTMDYDTRVS